MSKKRNWSLCSGQRTDTEASWGFAFSSSRETTLWSRLVLLRLWNWAAVLQKFSLHSKQQKVAGCFSSQASQSCVPVCSVCPACSLGASFTMSNNAKFFNRPWTPVGTATACLHLGQSMLLPWSSLSKQLKQKLSTTQKPRTFFFVIVTFITDWTLWSLERHCLKKSTFFTNEWRGNYRNNKKSEKALSQIWHVFVDPLKHCFRLQFSFLMKFFQSHRETFLQNAMNAMQREKMQELYAKYNALK